MILTDPQWLWLLLALAPLLLLEWRAAVRSEKGLAKLVGQRPEHALLAQRRTGQRRLGAFLRLGAFVLLVIGAAGPEWGREVVRRGATGSDVVFVLDVSASMDARDVAPSRLAEARREALAVLERLEGSRIGVVAFAGDAVRMCPLTLERSAVRLTLEALSSGSVSNPGTDLGKALRMARRVMPPGRREEQAIVIWTDGEDLEKGAESAIDEIAASGVRVFAVGVGTPTGDVVPVLDDQGRAIDVKRDASGGPVRSRLDQTLLQTLARRTRGGYFSADQPGGELPRLLSALGTVARAARGERLVERPVARFTLFAVLAFLLLLLDRMRARRRVASPDREVVLTGADARRAGAMAVLLLLLVPPAAEAQSAWARGNGAFRAGRYAEAESLYTKRLEGGGPDAVRVNLATARALSGSPDGVDQALARLAEAEGEAGHVAGYNLGTHLGEAGDYEHALQALRRTLERNPDDEDARWNYEVLMQRQREQERQQRQPDDQRPQEQPPPQDQQQQQQGGSGQSPPDPQQGAPQQQPSNPSPSSSTPREGMDRAQAERLLGALEELQRLERQRQRKVRAVQEKPGRDW